jgi:hypothetical protein
MTHIQAHNPCFRAFFSRSFLFIAPAFLVDSPTQVVVDVMNIRDLKYVASRVSIKGSAPLTEFIFHLKNSAPFRSPLLISLSANRCTVSKQVCQGRLSGSAY